MGYIINLTNGDPLVTVDDGRADLSSTSIALIGKNYAGYGEYLNENLVHLLENFAKDTAPSNPLVGQLWFDKSQGVLKVYNGTTHIPAGSSIVNDNTSSSMHYLTFVSSSTNNPPPVLKTDSIKGLTYQPSTGNMALNKSTGGVAKFEINAGRNDRNYATVTAANYSTDVNETLLRLTGEDGKNAWVQIDTYQSGPNSPLSTGGILFRKSRGTSQTPESLQNDDYIGGLAALGFSGNQFLPTGVLVFYASGNYNANSTPSGLRVFLTNSTSTITRVTADFKSNGDLDVMGDVVAYAVSDSRLKTNIQPLNGALDRVSSISGVTFNWNTLADGKDTQIRQVGVLADQIRQVLPEAVQEKSTGYLGVDYQKIVPLLIEAVKELRLEVQQLKIAQ